MATGKYHLGVAGVNPPVHASKGKGFDHVVDVCGAGTLEQSLKAVPDEGIISDGGIFPTT